MEAYQWLHQTKDPVSWSHDTVDSKQPHLTTELSSKIPTICKGLLIHEVLPVATLSQGAQPTNSPDPAVLSSVPDKQLNPANNPN